MGASISYSGTRIEEPRSNALWPAETGLAENRVFYIIYAFLLAVSVSTWFIAIRSPLWLDETGSYWQIHGGFSEIWPRRFQGLSFPGYPYILWISTKIIGTSEIALRVPSVLAMLGAVYLLYRAARELFNREIAFLAAILFSRHPIVVFAAIDVRPYAFAALATNAAILIVLRMRRNHSIWLAALFGFSAALIVWFHLLFGVILPVLVLCLFVVKADDRKALWRQLGVALAVFAVAFLPAIPSLLTLFRTAGTHVYEAAPNLGDLAWTFAPQRPWAHAWVVCGVITLILFAIVLVAGRRSRSPAEIDPQSRQVLLCASLAFVPLLILYGVSKGTAIHCFAERYRLVALPGIALCWAIVFSYLRPRAMRLLFCFAFVSITAFHAYTWPGFKQHEADTWKYALEAVEKDASVDNAPVLICSGFVESDYVRMPVDSAKGSMLFAPLSYYPLSVPVVPLPRTLNEEAIRVGSAFLQEAARKHERFFALEAQPPNMTLAWLTREAAGTHSVRPLWMSKEAEVLEFDPLPLPVEPR